MLIFGHSPRPWRLDLLVVDVDGVDCLIIEEVLQIVRPKVIQLEIVAHIPPPFRFSLQWHADHSHASISLLGISLYFCSYKAQEDIQTIMFMHSLLRF